MQMQPVSLLAPARPHARVVATCQARATTSRGGRAWRVAPTRPPRPLPRARAASCGGGERSTQPIRVEARKAVEEAVDQDQAAAEAGLAPEELEVLEEEAIAGEDEGRRPTDYDRRAHIFEESSRVFRELKHQRDGDAHGGAANAAATAAGAGTREQQEKLG